MMENASEEPKIEGRGETIQRPGLPDSASSDDSNQTNRLGWAHKLKGPWGVLLGAVTLLAGVAAIVSAVLQTMPNRDIVRLVELNEELVLLEAQQAHAFNDLATYQAITVQTGPSATAAAVSVAEAQQEIQQLNDQIQSGHATATAIADNLGASAATAVAATITVLPRPPSQLPMPTSVATPTPTNGTPDATAIPATPVTAIAVLIPPIPAVAARAAESTLPEMIQADLVLPASHSPYVVSKYSTIAEGATLYIEPGVVVKFNFNGLLGIQGRIVASGTSQQPVVFTSIMDDTAGGDTNNDGANTLPEIGDWGSITFLDNASHDDSVLNHVIVRYGGFHQDKGEGNGNDWYYAKPGHWDVVDFEGVIRLADSSPTIANSIIEDNRQALHLEDSSPRLLNNWSLANNREN